MLACLVGRVRRKRNRDQFQEIFKVGVKVNGPRFVEANFRVC